MYAGPSQSIALGDPMNHLPLQSQNCTWTLNVGEKIIQKIGTFPLATAVFLPQNGLKTLRSGPFNAGESSQSWPYRIPAKAGHNYMVQHGVLKLNNHQLASPNCLLKDRQHSPMRSGFQHHQPSSQRCWFCEEKIWRFAVRMVFSRLKCAEQSKIPSIKWPMSILPHIFCVHRQYVPACIFPVAIQNTGSWCPLIPPQS